MYSVANSGQLLLVVGTETNMDLEFESSNLRCTVILTDVEKDFDFVTSLSVASKRVHL